MTLNKKQIAWLEDLRGGKFKQGRGRLRLDDQYCCLGVACSTLNANGWTLDIVIDGQSIFQFEGTTWDLDYKSREELCISEEFMGKLINLNDVQLASFETIADKIEKYWATVA